MNDSFQKMFATMVEQGQEMVRAFNPALETMSMKGFDAFMPTMPADMMEMWFGRTFNKEGLDAKTRLLVTLAALTVLGAQAEPQIRLTIRHLIEVGATKREVAEVITQMSMFGGVPAMATTSPKWASSPAASASISHAPNPAPPAAARHAAGPNLPSDLRTPPWNNPCSPVLCGRASPVI